MTRDPDWLTSVEWTPVPEADRVPGERYATHAGVLSIGGIQLAVYRLDDGTAVIDAEDMLELLGALE